jgi:deoxyribonuclease-2
MYNDQPDNATPSSSSGHTKGVVSTGSSPFWLMHSTPNFPSSNGKSTFYFPESEIIYGQTFLCVKMSASNIEDMATQLSFTHPYVYVNKIKDTSGYPILASILDGTGFNTQAGTSVKKFGSVTHMAKNANWGDDLYENLVAKTLKSDLVVESWIRGSAEGTYCKPKYDYEVVDVNNMAALGTDGTNITWRETQDHAKWCLSVDSGYPWVCIADINRMTSQRKRGGGIFCFKNANLAAQMSGSIVDSNECSGDLLHSKHHTTGHHKKSLRGGEELAVQQANSTMDVQ